MAVLEKHHLGVNVVNGINNIVGFVAVLGPGPEQCFGAIPVKFLEPHIEFDPRSDCPETPLEALHFGQTHVCERCHRMSVQATQCDLVKVHQPQSRDA